MSDRRRLKNLAKVLGAVVLLSFLFSLLFSLFPERRVSFRTQRTNLVRAERVRDQLPPPLPVRDSRFSTLYPRLLREGKFAKAEELLLATPFPSSLRDYRNQLLLKLHIDSRRFSRARLLCRNLRPSPLSPWRKEILAGCLRAKGEESRWEEVEEDLFRYRRSLEKEYPDLVLFWRARLEEGKRNNPQALALQKSLLSLHPLSPWAQRVPAPRVRALLASLSSREREVRIRRLLRGGAVEAAKGEALRFPSPQRELFQGIVLYRRGLFKEAEASLSRVLPSTSLGPEAVLYRMRILFKREGSEGVERFFREQEGRGLAGENLWVTVGDFLYSRLNFSLSREYYEKAARKGLADEETWRKLLWLDYRLEGQAAALERLEEKNRLFRSPFPASELYWEARFREELRPSSPRARALYRTVALEYHQHYYGDLAWKRLGEKERTKILQEARKKSLTAGTAEPLPQTLPVGEGVDRVLHLLSLGLDGAAQREIEAFSGLYESSPLQGLAAELSSRAGQLFLVHRYRLRTLHPYGLTTSRRLLSYAYPISPEIFPLVERSSGREGIDPLLVLSLMRQESFFRSDALSFAGARGLLQLLPSTAARMARRGGLPVPRPEELFLPRINIPLGVIYLRELFSLLGEGKTHWVLASYNAGENRALLWEKAFQDYPNDVAVEMVPFSETRNYIKIVLSNRRIYGLLSQGEG